MSENPLDRLERDIEPPPELEIRVTAELAQRGLIARAQAKPMRWIARRPLAGLAAAASLALVVGFALGRAAPKPATHATTPATTSAHRYALLLYQTEGYRRASGPEEIERYHEYSRWVAEARRREQFVTGEDLEVSDGWVLTPDGDRARVAQGTSASGSASLSGVFLITASDNGQALELAQSLPHLAHGGEVVIQKVLPTERPPVPKAK